MGGATVTQVQTDADAALTDATLDAGAVKGASDSDALAVQKYTKQESALYESETEDDASLLESEQVNVAQQEKYIAGQWNVNAVVYEDGNQVEGVPEGRAWEPVGEFRLATANCQPARRRAIASSAWASQQG